MISNNEIISASTALQKGECVAFPTETVYGLGADATNDNAVAQIYAIKNRPDFNPLIVHVANIDDAKKYAAFNAAAEKLAKYFWPGELTLVLPRNENCILSLLVSAGLPTVAIRVPNHPLAQALLKESGVPIAAPSANISGRVSPTTAAHVHEELGGKIAHILDGGACDVGLESTVVDVTGDVPVILRPGGITKEQIAQYCALGAYAPTAIASPGMLESHYAPNAALRLDATTVDQSEALLAFGKVTMPTTHIHVRNLSERGDLKEAAANLFRMLRELDKTGAKCIAVMTIPEEGLGVAINDRLKRAAAPRQP